MQEAAPGSTVLDTAGECFLFVVDHLFGEGVECPGPKQCSRNAPCRKASALYAFSARKFAAEEEAMRRTGYDGREAHEDDHRRFLDRLNAIVPTYRCDEALRHLKALIDDWTRSHLDTFDGTFGWWVARANTVTETGEVTAS